MLQKQLRKFIVFRAKVLLLTKLENGFQIFVLVIHHLRDETRLGHSSNLNQDALRELVECNWELTLNFNTSQPTICCHLKKIERVSKVGFGVSHTLSEKNWEDCIFIVTSLLWRPRNDLFLKNIITGVNVLCKRQWIDKDEFPQPTSKPELHERKLILCVWWDQCLINNLFWVFKMQSDTQSKLILSIAIVYAWKSKKMLSTHQ